MKTILQFAFLILTILFLGTACSGSKKDDPVEEPDTTPPTLSVSTPAANQKYSTSGTIKLTANFQDDTELKECKVSLTISNKGVSPDPWKPDDEIYALSGKEDALNNQTVFGSIPTDIETAAYIFSITVTDKAGNTSTPKLIDIEIE